MMQMVCMPVQVPRDLPCALGLLWRRRHGFDDERILNPRLALIDLADGDSNVGGPSSRRLVRLAVGMRVLGLRNWSPRLN